MKPVPACRFCATPLTATFCDLGETPLANSYLDASEIAGERRFALVVRICPSCLLVQADDSVPPDAIFGDYAYFSSYSASWVEHARNYAGTMIGRFGLGPHSLVVEIASNDGYLLQHFQAAGVPVLGVEPAANVAQAARARSIETEVAFFGVKTAKSLVAGGRMADQMVANNVLAHVPDIKDFLGGFAVLLKREGVATFEFPHILNLVRQVQFDTIYHEHFSYLSLFAVEQVLASVQLKVFDIEQLPTHGGSLRLYVAHSASSHQPTPQVAAMRTIEHSARLDRLEGYSGFAAKVGAVKAGFKTFLKQAKAGGKTIAGYGAAAKGNTFLNVCGTNAAGMVCVFDRSLAKQGKLLPGSHIPVLAPERLAEIKPDYLVILPWNLAREVMEQNPLLASWGGRFVTAVPEIRILSGGVAGAI